MFSRASSILIVSIMLIVVCGVQQVTADTSELPRIRPIPLMRFPGAFLESNTDLVAYVWYIEGANSRILVDAGCEETAAIWVEMGGWVVSSLDDGLARVGLTPEDVDIVIFTHLHPDHVGHANRFTNARLIVQSAELESALNEEHLSFNLVKDLDFETISGDQQIDDNVQVLLTPGHTPGGQSVLVETAAGKAVITGFCCSMEHLEPTITPPPLFTDRDQLIESMQRVAEIADILIPLHDYSFADIDAIPTEQEANKAIVRRLYEEVFNAKNMDVIDEIFATDFISYPGVGNPDIYGPEGVKQFIAGFLAGLPDIQSTIENLIAEGDKVFARVTIKGTHQGELMGIPPTEKQVTMTAILIFRIADGKMVEEWRVADFLGMMQQLGVIAPGRPSPENYLWSAPSAVTGDPGTPEENKAIALRAVEELWNQHNVDLVDEFFAADFIGHNPVLSGVYPEVGTESMKQAITDHFTAFPDFHVTVHDTLAERDKLAQLWTVTGTHKGEFMGIPPSGNQVTFAGITISRFADGKIVEQWWCYDALGMMQQITPPSVSETEANRALFLRYADEVVSQGKMEVMDEIIAEDFVHRGAGVVDAEGIEGNKALIAMLRTAFPDLVATPEDVIAEGDKAIILTTYTGTHQGDLMGVPPTGVAATFTGICIARAADGKLAEIWTEYDVLGLMQQLGVVTPGRPPEYYAWSAPLDVTGDPGDPVANKALVMRFIDEVWNQQNLDVLDEIFAADVLGHNPPIEALYGPGIENLRQSVTDYITAFPDIHAAVDDMVAEGDKVVVRWTATGTHQGELMGIPPSGKQVTWTGHTIYRIADGKIVEMWWAWDTMGMMQQLTAPPEKDFSNVFFMSLEQGLNMISLPLEPTTPYTARSFAEEIGATVVIRYDTTLGKFVGFTLSASDDGFTIEGGEGYIVNVLESKVVPFTGAAWTNEPPVEAAPPAQASTAWAFVVSGSVDGMSAADDSCTVIVRNLRTGHTFTESVDSSGYFAAAWADLSRKAVIRAGDQVEATVVDSSGEIVSGPFIHDITLDEIRNAVANLHLKLGEIIPEKTELLQNYPNPFNPETWIPFHLNSEASVSIRIYSIAGQLIRTLELGDRDAGIYISRSRAAYWDGKNEAGEQVASGVYFYTIQAGDFTATKKMIIAR
jgi:steroid delta-isomerase-like uncharacterized protein